MEHRPREKHQNADGLSKKTESYDRKQIKDENLQDHKPNFKFLADPTLFDRPWLTVWRWIRCASTADNPRIVNGSQRGQRMMTRMTRNGSWQPLRKCPR